jgi:hypothetical protein
MVTNFGSNISTLDTWKALVSFCVPDLHDERHYAIVIFTHLQSGVCHTVSSWQPHFTWPILGRSYGRWVDYEFVCLLVKLSSGFKPSYIGSVAQLSLRIAPVYLVVLDKGQPLCLLLFSGKINYRVRKHGVVQTYAWLSHVDEQGKIVSS